MKYFSLIFFLCAILVSGCRHTVLRTDPPGAKIFIDGRDSGLTTPAKLQAGEYKRGDHEVEFKLAGYMPKSASFSIERDPSLVILSLIPPTALVVIPAQLYRNHWNRFSAPFWEVYLQTIEEHERIVELRRRNEAIRREEEAIRREEEATRKKEEKARALRLKKATFFGLTIGGKLDEETVSKLGQPDSEKPYDENMRAFYSSSSFAPFEQVAIGYDPKDKTITSLYFCGYFDAEEMAEKYLQATKINLQKYYSSKCKNGVDFCIVREPNDNVYRLILLKVKPKKGENVLVVDKDKLKIYNSSPISNKTLLILDVIGYSYKLDSKAVEKAGKVFGELRPIDKQQEELKDATIGSGKKM